MEKLDYWRLCEELNIVQATMLIIGEDPSHAEYAEGWEVHKRPNGYEAMKMAISGGLKNHIKYEKEYEEFEQQLNNSRINWANAPEGVLDREEEQLAVLHSNSIVGTLVRQSELDINGNDEGSIDGTVDLYKSMVDVDSLKRWLSHKGFSTGFFFPNQEVTLDFLDPLNPRYAPKLAAAVRAWQSVTDAGKRSPKQALDKWLREHASEFGLTDDEGKPIDLAIKECSKVANWNAKGGATKTPS